MLETTISIILIFIFLTSLMAFSPKTSLTLSILAFMLAGFSLLFITDWILSLMVIFLSVFAVMSITLQTIMYFDLEKEFQRQYKRDVTSIVSVLFSAILFGVFVVLLKISGFMEDLKRVDYSGIKLFQMDAGGEYMYAALGVVLFIMGITGITLVKEKKEVD